MTAHDALNALGVLVAWIVCVFVHMWIRDTWRRMR